MDGDPAVEPELDGFSLILPLPYRIAVIFVLGVWAWAINLQFLAFYRIVGFERPNSSVQLLILKQDVASLIRYPHRSSGTGPPPHLRVYRLASAITFPLIGSLVLFWLITHGNPQLVSAWDLLPQSYLFLLFLFFALPIHRVSKLGRYWFLKTLRRVSVGGIAESQDGKFGDILLADVLTSYAKVLGDFFVSGCMFFARSASSTSKPDRSCGGAFMVPLIIALPFAIRFRQCIIEYRRVRRSMRSSAGAVSSGWGGTHLANALKYATAFPVTILSALQRGYDPTKIGMSETGLFRLWVFFVFVNSFYSFYWDVAKDWDLTLFSGVNERENPEHPWGLRRQMAFGSANLYYTVVVIDLVLRCTWSLKLSPHLDHFNDWEGGIFIMEFLEVLRRWIWIFFRVETEWVRTNRGPGLDEILLSTYNDEDSDKLDYDE